MSKLGRRRFSAGALAAGATFVLPRVARAHATLTPSLLARRDGDTLEVTLRLRASERVLRRTWWDLLRHAVDLPDYFHEPVVEPGTPGARHVTREQALEALEARLK